MITLMELQKKLEAGERPSFLVTLEDPYIPGEVKGLIYSDCAVSIYDTPYAGYVPIKPEIHMNLSRQWIPQQPYFSDRIFIQLFFGRPRGQPHDFTIAEKRINAMDYFAYGMNAVLKVNEKVCWESLKEEAQNPKALGIRAVEYALAPRLFFDPGDILTIDLEWTGPRAWIDEINKIGWEILIRYTVVAHPVDACISPRQDTLEVITTHNKRRAALISALKGHAKIRTVRAVDRERKRWENGPFEQ